MGATFDTATGDWKGRVDGTYETANKVAGKEDPADGYLWRREIETWTRQRTGQGLSAFDTDAGDNVAGETLQINNGDDTLNGPLGFVYLVQVNGIVPDPQGSGIWIESHVAVGYTEWEQWLIPNT